jgi:hypothetical protein
MSFFLFSEEDIVELPILPFIIRNRTKQNKTKESFLKYKIKEIKDNNNITTINCEPNPQLYMINKCPTNRINAFSLLLLDLEKSRNNVNGK